MTRKATRTLAAVVVGILIPITTAFVPPARAASDPDPGRIGIGLLDAPVSLRDDPRAQEYIIDRLPPGAVIQRHLQVKNLSPVPRRFSLYAAAATIGGGEFKVAAGHTPDELTTWTKLDPPAVTVQPESDAVVTVTIAVARDAAPGERYGVLWAENAGPATGKNISLVNRVGVRMYLDVGLGNPPASNFTIVSFTGRRLKDGRPVVAAQVHNTGGRALDLSGTLKLTDGPGGLSAGPFDTVLGTTLAPGQSEPVSVTLDARLPDGPWKATFTLHSGLLYKTAHATIRFNGQTTLIGRSRYLTEILIGAAVAAVAALAVFLYMVRRRRPRNARHAA